MIADDTPADQWKKAVDTLIPLSHEIANKQAQIREATVFLHALGQVQSHVAHADDNAAAFEQLQPLLDPRSTRDVEGRLQLDLLMRQLFVTAQLVETRRSASEHVEYAQRLIISDEDPCAGAFEQYRVDQTLVDAPSVDPAENVGLDFSSVPLFFVSLFTSTVQIVMNEDQNRRIKEDTQRFATSRAKDEDYRKYARQACSQNQQIYRTAVKSLDPLVKELKSWVRETSPVTTVHEQGLALLDTFTAEEVSRAVANARVYVRKQMLPEGEDAYLQRVQLKEVNSMAKAAEKLRRHPCDKNAVNSIHNSLAIARILHVPSLSTLSATANDLLSRASSRCGEAHNIPLKSVAFPIKGFVSVQARAALDRVTTDTCRQYSRSTFCQRLRSHTRPARDATGFSSTVKGGITARVSNYLYTSDIDAYWFYAPQTPWPTYRADIAQPVRIPGSTYAALAQSEANRLKAFIGNLETLNTALQVTAQELGSAARHYSEDPLPAATQNTVGRINSTLPETRRRIEAAIDSVGPVGLSRDNSSLALSLATPSIHAFADDVSSNVGGGTKTTREALETIWRAQRGDRAALSLDDRDALDRMYSRYFNSASLYKGAHPGTESLARQLGGSLSSQYGDYRSQDVRLAINRNLYAMDNSAAKGRELAGGGIGLALGADMAYAAGAVQEGDDLIRGSLVAADLALGFIPVVGGINDLAQIVHGIVTGRDYTGRVMTASDYALRGLGAAAGLTLAPGMVRVADAAISKSFVHGVRLIRGAGLGRRVSAALRSQRHLLAEFASGIGITMAEVAPSALMPSLKRAVAILEAPLGEVGKTGYVKLLQELGHTDAKQFVDSFDPKRLKFDVLLNELTVYRWHNGDDAAKQFGRFVSKDLIQDPNVARSRLALPDSNRTLFLDEFRIRPGTPIFEGAVLVEPGVRSGNQVFVVTQNAQSVLQLRRRIIP